MPAGWETVCASEEGTPDVCLTQRLPIRGGWLYRTRERVGGNYGRWQTTALVFVPDWRRREGRDGP